MVGTRGKEETFRLVSWKTLTSKMKMGLLPKPLIRILTVRTSKGKCISQHHTDHIPALSSSSTKFKKRTYSLPHPLRQRLRNTMPHHPPPLRARHLCPPPQLPLLLRVCEATYPIVTHTLPLGPLTILQQEAIRYGDERTLCISGGFWYGAVRRCSGYKFTLSELNPHPDGL